ncbi:carbohydrate ABC transporter substrate-binding protein (CUT1 family) [Krasilnikovia cinnamomea]|uniref:Carbohydrate ABC transporter substrate-binding protein (CUT1 family) n=1 Tax=Krasilnikovia cinnamomea TaxID=349313 RepID=A0A4Q7ZRP0_9ACTN|nr:ABC transporter substrate-binding protein [Krasilnikovia cinnamomea]RZU53504.1 carbohydrate ABC transporter substrate-binding protein (CUT1 family) [Krasilnikovia cinnamomea]
MDDLAGVRRARRHGPAPSRLRWPRHKSLLAATTAVVLLLTACSTRDDRERTLAGHAPDEVTITWWTGQSADAEQLAEQLAAEYQRLHPHVTIKTSAGASTTDDLLTKLSAGFTSDTYPDISYAYGSWAGELAASGRTQDLTDFVGDPAFGWHQMPFAARMTATVDGRVIGVPALVDNLALIHNKQLFDAAGVAYPTNDWSWDDFRQAARRLTDPGRGVYGTTYSVSGSEDTTWHLWPLLWQRGGRILDGKRPAFDSDAGVAALETLRAMAVDDRSMYLDQTDEKYGPLFNNGRIAMMMSGPWAMLELKQARLNYGVTMLPGFHGDHQTVSGPDLWVLFDHDDGARARAARDFVGWLTSRQIDAKWNLRLGNLPLRSSANSTPEFAAYIREYPGGQAFFDNLANAKQARPTIAGYAELSRHVGDAVAMVLQGAATPKEALHEAARRSVGALEDS